MLSDEERREIDREAALYPARRSAAIDALRIVQKHRGWVSDESLKDAAEYIGVPEAELDGIATFYNLVYREPVGRHVIKVCDSVSCWIMGYDAVREHLCRKLGIGLGGTSADGRFTLLPIVCLGACDHAPVMMIDEDTWFDLDPGKIDRILEGYR